MQGRRLLGTARLLLFGAAAVAGCRSDRELVIVDAAADAAVVNRDSAAMSEVLSDNAREVGGAEAPIADGRVEAGGEAPTLDAGADRVGAVDAQRARVNASDFAGEIAADSFTGQGTSWSRSLAGVADVVVVANADSNSMTLLSGTPLVVQAEIAVGVDPRSVAVTPDGRYAVVVNRGDATVSVVDLKARAELYFFAVRPLPYGAVIANGRIYVTEWATNAVAVYDPIARRLEARAVIGAFPAGIAHCGPPTCALPEGDGLLVSHFYSGQVTVLDTATMTPRQVITTGADTNFSQQIAISPDGRRAYLPQTRSFADNPTRQFDTTVFPVVNVIDLQSLTLLNTARITLDTADQPVGLPFAVDFTHDGKRIVVANAASDDLSIIDLSTGDKVAHVEVGAAPQGLLARNDDSMLVQESLAGTVKLLDKQGRLQSETPVTQIPLPPQILRGKRLFWSSARPDLARDQWMSCATCHFDGFHDARTWRSFPDGIRNTTALFNLADTLPLHWSGDLNEIHDVESTVRFIQAGKGLSPAPQIDTLGTPLVGASDDLDALAAFLATLRPPPSPHQNDPAAIARGKSVFARLDCTTCHAPPHFVDRKNHDVGTGDPATERNSHGRGTTFDTPSLRALWLTAPYLHDGSAATLEAVFERGTVHALGSRATKDERADLIAYLRSL